METQGEKKRLYRTRETYEEKPFISLAFSEGGRSFHGDPWRRSHKGKN